MPLKFKKLEAVEFGDFVSVPRLGTEKLLRLAKIDLKTQEGIDDATKLLASCFPDDEERVRVFMADNMNQLQIATLQAYLISGDDGVNMLRERYASFAENIGEE